MTRKYYQNYWNHFLIKFPHCRAKSDFYKCAFNAAGIFRNPANHCPSGAKCL
jgi:hypothetical protein